jgi:hypothetical protein
MAAIQPQEYHQRQTGGSPNDFVRIGHPGKYHRVITPSGSAYFTGSDYGAGAVITYGSAAGTAYLSNGGSIDLSKLAKGYIHELSISYVTGAADVYVLIRNQAVR